MIRQVSIAFIAGWLSICCGMSVVCADPPVLEGLDTNKPMILPLRVQAAYNNDTMFFNIQWVGDRGDTHDLLQFTNNAWQRDGGPRRDAQATIDNDPTRGATNLNSTNYESRVTWMINDPNGPNAVENFSNDGCFCTCHDDSRAMPEWDSSENKTKYLNEGTEGSLDLWHHRQARANPIGASDDQHVTQVGTNVANGGRFGDTGSSPWQVNNIVDGHPTWTLDRTEAGEYAYNFGDTHNSPNRFYRAPGTAQLGVGPVPQSMDWADAVAAGYVPAEGDTLPRRRLRTPTGSRGDISGLGTTFTADDPGDDHSIGTIESNTQRLLTTADVDGDTDLGGLANGDVFDIAFAVHTGMVTVRDHYVGFAMTLGNGMDADIQAMYFDGDGNQVLPNWNDIPVTEMDLFLPGITSLEFLYNENLGKRYYDPDTGMEVDQFHAGADALQHGGNCKDCHSASGGGLSMENLAWQRGGVWTVTPLRIPEPSAIVLMILGFAGIGCAFFKKRRKAA